MKNHEFSSPQRPHTNRRRARHGFGPDFGAEFGPGFGGGRPRGRRRGGRRGDVRAATLLLLAEEPRHGYQLIQEIGERTDGAWSPSPGSVYPVLQQLEDEGLVVIERVDGRKTASLTDAGTEYVEEHRAELGTPWEDVKNDPSAITRESATSLKALVVAWRQVVSTGTAEQQAAASAALDETRKTMYRILAGDDV